MPYLLNPNPCKVCGNINQLSRNKWHKKNQCFYLQSTCKVCESKLHTIYQQQHKEYFREKNKEAYLKKVGALTRQSPCNADPEITKEKKRISTRIWRQNNPEKMQQSRLRQKLNGNDVAKSSRRRAAKKNACVAWDLELTTFVCKEAAQLAKLRKNTTGISWHLDHIIPLQSKYVCGLHVWTNFQLLPAIVNIKKSNKIGGE